MIASRTKNQHIFHDLRSQIVTGALRQGQLLPSQLELTERYGVALGTVRQAVERLRSQGLVWSCRGKGTFVTDPQKAERQEPGIRDGRLQFALVLCNTTLGVLGESMVFAVQSVLEQHNADLLVRVVSKEDFAGIVDWAKPLAGLLIDGDAPPEGLEALARQGQRVVILGAVESCPPSIGQVLADTDGNIEMAVQLLHSHGHRHMALVHRPGTYFGQWLEASFRQATAALGLGRENPILLIDKDDEAQEALFAERLDALSPRPTAVIADGGQFACRLIHSLSRRGRRVPEDLSMLAISSVSVAQLSVPALSRIEIPVERNSRRAIEILLEMVKTGQVIRETMPARLVLGGTVRRIEASDGDGRDAEEARRNQDQSRVPADSSAVGVV